MTSIYNHLHSFHLPFDIHIKSKQANHVGFINIPTSHTMDPIGPNKKIPGPSATSEVPSPSQLSWRHHRPWRLGGTTTTTLQKSPWIESTYIKKTPKDLKVNQKLKVNPRMIRMVSFILGLCWSFLLDYANLKYHYARLGCPNFFEHISQNATRGTLSGKGITLHRGR